MKTPSTLRALASIALFAVAGCGASYQFHTDFDPGNDFTGYRTYAWMADRPSGDPRVDDLELLHTALHHFVNRELAAKGYTMVESTEPADFYVGYYVAVRRDFNIDEMNAPYGFGEGVYWPTWSTGYNSAAGPSRTYMDTEVKGYFVLDVVDSENRRLVWRSQVSGDVTFYEEGTDESPGHIEANTARILRDFPSR